MTPFIWNFRIDKTNMMKEIRTVLTSERVVQNCLGRITEFFWTNGNDVRPETDVGDTGRCIYQLIDLCTGDLGISPCLN